MRIFYLRIKLILAELAEKSRNGTGGAGGRRGSREAGRRGSSEAGKKPVEGFVEFIEFIGGLKRLPVNYM
jgi:hypothetical protein